MAAIVSSSILASPVTLSSKRSEISGGVGGLEARIPSGLPLLRVASRLTVQAKGKKGNYSEPFGPAGGVKFKGGVDASGRKATGKGVYQFSKKYGANVDGYSPIYNANEWAESGDVYQGGQTGLALWAVTFGALLLVGAFLVYNTSALV
jgi:photosystem II protein